MKNNPWRKILGFGALAVATVGTFLFNLSMIHLEFNMGGYRAFNNAVFTGLAAVISVALLVWAVRDVRRRSQELEDLSAPSAQEQWEAAHPELTDGSYRREKKKEKHSVGYWIKEFFRVGLIPALLVVGIWLGSYYLFIRPIEGKPEVSVACNEEKGVYNINFLYTSTFHLADSIVEKEPVSLCGYQIPEFPEGFSWVKQTLQDYRIPIYNSPTYQNQEGHTIQLKVCWSNNGYDVPLAYASSTEELTINGCSGVLVEYETGAIELAWGDLEHTAVLSIRATGVDKDTILRMAEGFTYIGE